MSAYKFSGAVLALLFAIGPGLSAADSWQADSRPVGQAQSPDPPPDPVRILQDALESARATKYPHYRIDTLLQVAELLQPFDPQAAQQVLEEAIAELPALKKHPSLGETSVNTIVTALTLGMVRPARHSEGFVESSIEYQRERDSDYLFAVRLVAPRDARRALQLALEPTLPYNAWKAVKTAAAAWPREASESFAGTIRRIAKEMDEPSEKQQRRPSVVLAALAAESSDIDAALASDLARRAATALHPKLEPWERSQVFGVLTKLDPEAAAVALERMLLNPETKAADLAAFALGAAERDPGLAWRALAAIAGQSTELDRIRAVVLRQIASALRAEQAEEVGKLALSLLESTEVTIPKIGVEKLYRKMMRSFQTVADAVVSLGVIDRKAAFDQIEKASTGEHTGAVFLYGLKSVMKDKKERKALTGTYLRDLTRLDLILSLETAEPLKALAVLESFDRRFWIAFSFSTTWNRDVAMASYEADEIDLGAHENRQKAMLRKLRQLWPKLAESVAEKDPVAAKRTLHRFLEVAEWLDSTLVGTVVGKERKNLSEVWLESLPFALVAAGVAIHSADPAAAQAALARSVELADQVPTPFREWARCRNANAWQELATPEVVAEGLRAARLAAAIADYDPFHLREHELIREVARLDPAAALTMARRPGPERLRSLELVAVVAGMTADPEDEEEL